MEIGLTLITNGHCMELTKEMFELIFPQGLFDWFELTDGRADGPEVSFTLTEKDLPPLSTPHQTIVARKFHNMTLTDFPLRGKRTRLTIRRRYWKLEGQAEYLKRDNIPLCCPGTQLEKAFADFLKAPSGD
jgi:hypothetical protein